MQLNGAEILVRVLIEEGVSTVFGYPGGAVLNIYDALYHHTDSIHHVITAHEQGAAHAADGYARATGRTGVVLATSGPGATNLVTGIATAYMDSVPMVAITGNVSTPLIGCDSFQEVYIAGITMPITKHNFVVRRVEELADTLREAFRIAHTGRFGPVLVDVPKDVTVAVTEYLPKEAALPAQKTARPENLFEVAAMINNAKRPFVCFGGGVQASGAGEQLRELLRKSDMPAAYTLMAAGVLGFNEPHNLGLIGMHGCYAGNRAVKEADLLLAIGTRFSDRVALNINKFAPNAKVVQIDIDESEIGKNVPVHSSMVGDVKDILTMLLPQITEQRREAWQGEIAAWKKQDLAPTDDPEDRLRPHQIVRTACELAGEDAIFVTDVGQHQLWAAQYLSHVKPHHFLTSGGLGTMGYGYGAAIGAKIAKPDAPVIHFTGDGSFHMNLQEACTAVSYGVPVITVIFNNSVLGMVRQWQATFYERRFSQSEPERVTDFPAVARGFGADGYRCTNKAELREALTAALKNGRPAWIECIIDREERVLPMIPSGATVDETIFS